MSEFLEQFMAQALHDLSHREGTTFRPATIAQMDQTQARNADAMRKAMRKAPGEISESQGIPPVRLQALMIGIGYACNRLQPKPCPHFDYDLGAPEQDIVINLTGGWAACPPCHHRLVNEYTAKHGLHEELHGDDRCDLCDEPTTVYTEVGIQWGVAYVWMNVCGACYGWMTVPVGGGRNRGRRR